MGNGSKKSCGEGFKQKKPTPSGEPEPVNFQNAAGDRSPENKTNGNRRHEARDGFGPVMINEPVRKINDHARKKSCFSRAQQKSRAVKFVRRSDETGQRCQGAPTDQRYGEQPSR